MRNEAFPTYLYVAICRASDGIYAKVGISLDMAKRMRQLQTGCPIKLHAFYASRFPSRSQALAAELECHLALSDFHSSGEWYRFQQPAIEHLFEIVGNVLASLGSHDLERVNPNSL